MKIFKKLVLHKNGDLLKLKCKSRKYSPLFHLENVVNCILIEFLQMQIERFVYKEIRIEKDHFLQWKNVNLQI